jgi:DNA-binding NarL/FixJ family response regulator
MSRTRLLLVDDHPLIRGGLKAVLDAEPDLVVVAEADGVTTGWDALQQHRPDVLVCDVSMPDGNGLALVRRARQERRSLGIVVLTMHGDDGTRAAARDAGASAVVLKSAALEEVLLAVRRAAVQPGGFHASVPAEPAPRPLAGERVRLTPRETEVLLLLKDGLSNSQVARRLHLRESTVKTHVGKLYAKLGAGNRAQAVMNAVRLQVLGVHDQPVSRTAAAGAGPPGGPTASAAAPTPGPAPRTGGPGPRRRAAPPAGRRPG